MRSIPLISGDAGLRREVERAISGCAFRSPEIPLLADSGEALEHLRVELPDLMLLHFDSAELDAEALLDEIMHDQWLIHGGIIALSDDEETTERLEGIHGSNLVVIFSPGRLAQDLPRLLGIMHHNRRILFQRMIGIGLMPEISGQFRLHNDPLEARCYTNLVCNFLFNANRIDSETKESLRLAIFEMLANAIEHGNCGISYAEKTRWLEQHGTLAELIERRTHEPGVADRRVTFEYAISPEASRFLIADEGDGFDWRTLEDATDATNLLKSHGRGIMMTRAVTHSLRYNEKGNEVRFEVAHQRDRASLAPAIVRGMATRRFREGDVVFAEGDRGNSLYYIAKGRYDVFVGERRVARLSPDDMFLGEMSFLLDDRRSATVRASSEGKLIEISKRDFVRAVQEHPHYALLLSRLLAQRIQRANELQRRASKRRGTGRPRWQQPPTRSDRT